jgi:hypothetical protein
MFYPGYENTEKLAFSGDVNTIVSVIDTVFIT